MPADLAGQRAVQNRPQTAGLRHDADGVRPATPYAGHPADPPAVGGASPAHRRDLVVRGRAAGLSPGRATPGAGAPLASHTGGRPSLVPIPRGSMGRGAARRGQAVPAPDGPGDSGIGVRTKLIRLASPPPARCRCPRAPRWPAGTPAARGPARPAQRSSPATSTPYSGPGVFFRLRELRPGDLVYVRRGHARIAVFKVTAVRTYLKSKFPTAAVYGARAQRPAEAHHLRRHVRSGHRPLPEQRHRLRGPS